MNVYLSERIFSLGGSQQLRPLCKPSRLGGWGIKSKLPSPKALKELLPPSSNLWKTTLLVSNPEKSKAEGEWS